MEARVAFAGAENGPKVGNGAGRRGEARGLAVGVARGLALGETDGAAVGAGQNFQVWEPKFPVKQNFPRDMITLKVELTL